MTFWLVEKGLENSIESGMKKAMPEIVDTVIREYIKDKYVFTRQGLKIWLSIAARSGENNAHTCNEQIAEHVIKQIDKHRYNSMQKGQDDDN